MKSIVTRMFLVLLVLLLTVATDQITKKLAQDRLKGTETRYIAGDIFVLHYMENRGAFLGMGAGFPGPVRILVFVAFPVLMLVGLLIFIFRKEDAGVPFLLGLSLITGGGIGNLIDRILYHGSVTDFMNLGIGNIRTGVFNFADFFVLVGLGLVVIFELARKPAKKSS